MLLVTEFTNERGETYTVLQLLKRLRRAIIQIDEILFEHKTRIEILEIDVEKIKNDIDNIKEQLLNIINRVDIVENKVEIVEETLITIENNITNIETILNNHGSDISELNTLVTNITTELNELQGIVDSIPIVSASPLNGYIKIDGIDTPVFVGGGGGSGGGGFLIDVSDTLKSFTGEVNVDEKVLEFEIPEGDEFVLTELHLPFKLRTASAKSDISLKMQIDDGEIKTISMPNTSFINLGVYYIYQYNLKILASNNSVNANVLVTEQGYGGSGTDYGGNTTSNLNADSTEVTNVRAKKITIYITHIATEGTTKLVHLSLPRYWVKQSVLVDSGGSGESGESDNTVYTTKLNTLTNGDLNIYKNIWTLPCPPSAIGENSRFEYDATYAISVDKIDKINFQCSIMGAEMNLGEININSFEENFIYMKINLIGGTRKINDNEYYTSSNIEVIISNSNTTTKTSRVLARLNSNRGGNGAIGVDGNIRFNMMFTGDEVADRNSSMARGMLKSFYDIKELI